MKYLRNENCSGVTCQLAVFAVFALFAVFAVFALFALFALFARQPQPRK